MKLKKILSAALLIGFAFLLSSCALGDLLISSLGFDNYDYEGEPVKEYLEAENENVLKLCSMIRMLSLNNPYVCEFKRSGAAMKECRDSILNYMLCTSFSKYTGNPELLEDANAEYPELQLLSLIPAKDFENFVYTNFGGNAKLTHKSGTLFTYLEKVEAYTALSVPIESDIEIKFISCEETEKTYRLVFQNSLGDVVSPVYRAIFIKREDGSVFFRSLLKNE